MTTTPSSFNQFVVAVRAGIDEYVNDKLGIAASVKKAFHENKEMPSQCIIKNTCGKDPALAAQYFIEIMIFLIERIVGWNSIKNVHLRVVDYSGKSYHMQVEFKHRGIQHCMDII